MSPKLLAARNLAAAFMAGPWLLDDLVDRGQRACGCEDSWVRRLAKHVLAVFNSPSTEWDWSILAKHINDSASFGRAYAEFGIAGRSLVRQVFWLTPTMAPIAGRPATWTVPALATSAALADWLALKPHELGWFADIHGRETDVRPGPLRHYSYRWLPKATGSLRLLEVPKGRLRAMQRRLLHEILDRIPPHDAAHGYACGRSIATFTAPHCGRRIVLRFDLRHFFPSVRLSRIHAVFTTAGYPPTVARLLTGLCTNRVPDEVWGTAAAGACMPWEDRQRYRQPHLPQGAPTSPSLANLCAHRLDRRLHRLAHLLGASYTRYADDLAFSGGEELERSARRFQVQVCRIALEEGFEVHTRKSRFMRQGVCQQLLGIVVNVHPNVRRTDYDRLKALLHNCARHGPASQNRDQHADFRAHLLGRIAHVTLLNAARGERLRTLFQRIHWDEK